MSDEPFFNYAACTVDALNRALHERLRAVADEIKRLRERTEYWPDNAERDAVIRHQKKEIERLRAALEPLACTCDRANGGACSRAEANCAFWNARAALEGRT